MSSAGKSFGTSSPPLEATDSAKPMGVSSIDGGEPKYVSDSKQREEYFPKDGHRETTAGGESKPQEKTKTD
ncbi:hypothetical protein BXZ70DRAFT_1006181 [Cristinia sonorae]|uniref:Uncharacterized protein n=1 Tax=Cristinia sonorae TaxID=1940300 RepID=A0A8K0UUP5_9AGAR|nr:hypothetical protein BXZ70DRAFT_1006181 [Cristinia sonorae]